MTPNQRVHALIAPIAVLVAGLAATNWYLMPSRGPFWLLSMAMMAVAWLVAGLTTRPGLHFEQTPTQRQFLILSVDAAGLMLSVALAMALARRLGFESDALTHRVFGIVCGLLLIVTGNAVPKLIGPLAGKICLPAKAQSLQRFTGWSFVLAGLVYVAAWIVLPLKVAEPLSTAVCALAVVLVAGRLTLLMLSRRTSTPSA